MMQPHKMAKLMSQDTTKVLARIAPYITSIINHPCQIVQHHSIIRKPRHPRIIEITIGIKIFHDVYIHIFTIVPCIFLNSFIVSPTVAKTFLSLVIEDDTFRRITFRIDFCQTEINIQRFLDIFKATTGSRLIIICRQSLEIFTRLFKSFLYQTISNLQTGIIGGFTKYMKHNRNYILSLIIIGCCPRLLPIRNILRLELCIGMCSSILRLLVFKTTHILLSCYGTHTPYSKKYIQ